MKIFKAIFRFLDKYLFVPVSKFIYIITKRLGKSSKLIENWLSKPTTLIFISLFLAVTIFFIVDQKIINFSDNSAEVFKNQGVNVIYNEEAYVVEGVPETVDITLIGSKADLYIAKQSSNHDVTIDLTGLKPGRHKVSIEYEHGGSDIDYNVNPSVATVMIYEKISGTKKLTYDILNEENLDNTLVIDSVKLNTEEVTIRGAEYKINQVASVKALINVEDIEAFGVGTHTLEDIQLKAYDKDGNIVDVEFVPSKVSADVVVASPSKEVVLNFVPKGNIAFGKAISSYQFQQGSVTIYGTTEILSNIDSIDIGVDVSNITSDTSIKVEIPKPNGVKSMSNNSTTLDLKVTDVSSTPAEFSINLTGINLGDGLVAQPIDEDNGVIVVEVQGAKTVIDEITSNEITAYVDLKDKGPGEYELDVNVTGSNPLANYVAKKTKVKIRVTKTN
ncbi:MAG: hypothetical protein IJR82_00680 [Bacilli bacterium]|nr:hypothetical protein [Bacilli bacterium]